MTPRCYCGEVRLSHRTNALPLCAKHREEHIRAKALERDRRRRKVYGIAPTERIRYCEDADTVDRKLAIVDRLKRRHRWAA